MKKILCFIVVLALVLAASLALYAPNASANVQLFDTTYDFNYAYINLGNGTVIEGKVKSWKDWDDSDMVQVKMFDGTTYYTHGSNIVLVDR